MEGWVGQDTSTPPRWVNSLPRTATWRISRLLLGHLLIVDRCALWCKVEPCCWMTYTTHRDTQETLQILDGLDLDTDKPTEEDIMKKFGLDDEYQSGELTCWQRIKPRIWATFEEPYSSTFAKVSRVLSSLFPLQLFDVSCLKTIFQTILHQPVINWLTPVQWTLVLGSSHVNVNVLGHTPTPF